MTLDVATFSQIMTILTQLSTNYSSVFTNYYDIFLNPEPMDVSLEIYDQDGNLIPNEDGTTPLKIANRAKDRTYILNGEGNPLGVITALRGSMYQDTANGAVYINIDGTVDGWVKIIEEEELASYIRQGGGSPEGVVVASKGVLYIDKVNSGLYIKTTDTGSNGWLLISANTANLANVNLSNLSQEGENHFLDRGLENLNDTGIAKLAAKEDIEHKVLSISSSNNNTQYPSARATYTFVTNATTPKANRDMNNLTEQGEIYVTTQKQMRDCVLLAPSGVLSCSNNVATLFSGTVLLCADGLDTNNRHSNIQVSTSSDIVESVAISAESEGVVFYVQTSGMVESLRFCDEPSYYRQAEEPTVPSDTKAIWYDTNNNRYHVVSAGAWEEVVAAEIGRFNTNNSSTVITWNPFYPVSLVTKDELETFTKKMVTQASTTFEYTPDGRFVKNDIVFVDSLDQTFNPSTTSHPDAVWLYSSPVYPYVPMNLTNSGTSYSFANGGMVVCTSQTNVTLGAGELAPVTFTNFVGILPVAAGTEVSTSVTSYFVGY